MKKINRTRKRVLHKYRYLRFRELLIEKMCEVLSDTLDEVIINGLEKREEKKK